jgi:signal peptidase II
MRPLLAGAGGGRHRPGRSGPLSPLRRRGERSGPGLRSAARAAGRAVLRWGLAAAGITLGLDQLSKWAILSLSGVADRPLQVTPFFNLIMVWNRGVSFGMFDSAGGFAPWLLSGLALAVVVGLVIWLRRTEQLLTGLGIGLVIGGALGNVVDRIRFGAVVDFLDFHLAGYHWPAFNVADTGICVGAALMLADGLLVGRRGSR